VVHEALDDVPGITLMPPVQYNELVGLMKAAAVILSDSGGIQEEAPSLDTPVLVLRTTTERPEAIEAGVAILVGTDPESIVEHVEAVLSCPTRKREPFQTENPFGDGFAADRIVAALESRI
jgi:UDP-N-acetylglucosamine 2-epimerase (non-hydrolysing)